MEIIIRKFARVLGSGGGESVSLLPRGRGVASLTAAVEAGNIVSRDVIKFYSQRLGGVVEMLFVNISVEESNKHRKVVVNCATKPDQEGRIEFVPVETLTWWVKTRERILLDDLDFTGRIRLAETKMQSFNSK